MTVPFLDQPVERFLDRVAAREPAPGGGAVAAVTVAASAALVAMAARFAGARPIGGAEFAGRADELRSTALSLAREDAEAYTAVLAAYALPRQAEPARRAEQITAALRGAAEVPVQIACVAAEVAEMGVRLIEEGNPNLKGDAVCAVLLAEAAARAAAGLVHINTRLGKLGPGLPGEADRSADAAARARERAEARGI